jgi:ribosome-binding factor A
MSQYRKEKFKEIIGQLASNFINEENNHQSLITVTDVLLGDDLKQAKIMISILPDHKQEAGMDFLKRNRSDFKKYVKEKSKLNPIPFFDFEIDRGEKARQKVEEISLNL